MIFGFIKARRRRRLRRQPLPAEFVHIIEKNVPYYRHLPPVAQRDLHGLVQIFLAEKQFEGCGGLEISPAIRVTIAAQACMLLIGRETDIYPKLRSILVYPSAYVSNLPRHQPNGTVSEGPQARLGESWQEGYVILSWDDVLRGASDVDDGRNVVLHEFAHQLDSETGSTQGYPLLPKRSMYVAWARVLSKEYNKLIRSIEQNKPTLLDKYGGISPAEFFAVVTEFFFEKPVELKAKHPQLYKQLRLFYRQDPAALIRTTKPNKEK